MDTLPELVKQFETFCGGGKHRDTRRMLNAWKLGLLDDDKFGLSAQLMGGLDFDENDSGSVAQFYGTVLSGLPGNSAPALTRLLTEASQAYFYILDDHHFEPILSKGVVYTATPDILRDMVWGSHGRRISQLYYLDALCTNIIAFLCALTADYRVHFCHAYWTQFLDYVMDELNMDDLTGIDLDQVWDQVSIKPTVYKHVRAYAHMLNLCQFDTILPILDVYRPVLDPESKKLYRFFWTKLEPLAHQVSEPSKTERLFYDAAHDLNRQVLAHLAQAGRDAQLKAQDQPVEIETLQGGGGMYGASSIRRHRPQAEYRNDAHTKTPGHAMRELSAQLNHVIAQINKLIKSIFKGSSGGVAASAVATGVKPAATVAKSCGRSMSVISVAARRRCGPRSGPSLGKVVKVGLGVLGAVGVYANAGPCYFGFGECPNPSGGPTYPERLADIARTTYDHVYQRVQKYWGTLSDQTSAAAALIDSAYKNNNANVTTEDGTVIPLFQLNSHLTEEGKQAAKGLQEKYYVCVNAFGPALNATNQFIEDNTGDVVPAAAPYLYSHEQCTTEYEMLYKSGLRLDTLVQEATNTDGTLDMLRFKSTAKCMYLPTELVDFFVADAANSSQVPLPFQDSRTLCVLTKNENSFSSYGQGTLDRIFTEFDKLDVADKADSDKVTHTVCEAFKDAQPNSAHLWPNVCHIANENEEEEDGV